METKSFYGYIDKDVLKLFFCFLYETKTLEQLIFDNCKLDMDDYKCLSDALKINRSVKSLLITDCIIFDAKYISNIIKFNTTIKYFLIRETADNMLNIDSIAHAIKMNKSCKKIMLQWENQKKYDSLSDAFSINNTLRVIYTYIHPPNYNIFSKNKNLQILITNSHSDVFSNDNFSLLNLQNLYFHKTLYFLERCCIYYFKKWFFQTFFSIKNNKMRILLFLKN